MDYFLSSLRGTKDGKTGTLTVVDYERDSECVDEWDRRMNILLCAAALNINVTSGTYTGEYVSKRETGSWWVPDACS